MAAATPSEASAHPTYAMGAKINIDSATLMNKGLELIEAHHLFEVDPDRVDAVVHPQSIVHGLVTWRDGGVVAVLNHPDMRVPISHCLGEGSRLPLPARPLDLAAVGSLTFEPHRRAALPVLHARQAGLARGRGHADDPQRGERGRRVRLPCGRHRLPRHRGRGGADLRGVNGAHAGFRRGSLTSRRRSATQGGARSGRSGRGRKPLIGRGRDGARPWNS